MPFKVVKVTGGYKVQNTETKKFKSKNPKTKAEANAHLKAININYYKKNK